MSDVVCNGKTYVQDNKKRRTEMHKRPHRNDNAQKKLLQSMQTLMNMASPLHFSSLLL